MHSTYDNMQMNVIFYASICINNNINTSISFMISVTLKMRNELQRKRRKLIKVNF